LSQQSGSVFKDVFGSHGFRPKVIEIPSCTLVRRAMGDLHLQEPVQEPGYRINRPQN